MRWLMFANDPRRTLLRVPYRHGASYDADARLVSGNS